MNADTLKNREAVEIEGGASMGRVDDVLFDTEGLRIYGLILQNEGRYAILPFGSVHNVGNDAITVEDPKTIQPPTDGGSNAMRPLADLIGLRVLNREGSDIGAVQGVMIDEKSGVMTGLELHEGGMLGMGGTRIELPVSAIRGIGPKFVTVDDVESVANEESQRRGA